MDGVRGQSVAILAVFLVAVASAAKLPSSFKRCRETDSKFNDCLTAAVQNSLREMSKGVQSLGVLPIDPLEVTAIAISRGGSGPVDISLDFSNMKIWGLSALVVDSIQFDTKNFKIDGKVHARSPVNLQGDYKIDGRVMILPIKGAGKCNLSLDDLDVTFNLRGERLEKNGEVYMKLNTFTFSFDTNRLHVHFENLFNGDKALGDNMNAFLNANWRDILQELKPAIEATFGGTFKEITNRIFLKVPYNQLFLS